MRLRSAPGPLILALALSAAVPVSAVSAAQAHLGRPAVRPAARTVARQARAASRAAALPARVYAPYFETWTRTTIDGLARRSAAIARLEAWAPRTGRRVQAGLTVGAIQSGFPASSRRVIASAIARAHQLPLVTIRAIQRDNGGCPGHVDSDTCSGLRQPPFEFSVLLAR
jgi:hypothetical protein